MSSALNPQVKPGIHRSAAPLVPVRTRVMRVAIAGWSRPGQGDRMLVVVSGLPGTGKSTLADALARRLGAVRVSVDPIEDALLSSGLPPSWETGVAAYRAAAAVAELNLSIGRTVVADAVNDSEAARDTWRSAAARAGSPITFVVLHLADTAAHRRRIEHRTWDLAHVPPLAWQDVLDRASSAEPWTGDDHLRIDAGAPVEEIVVQVLAWLRDG